jgi:predicted nucleotidyltransferase
MGAIGQLASELGAPERSLRRAVALGTIRSRRLSARRLRLLEGELDYLRDHWGLLAALRQALRTEPILRTAVLIGSVARGDDRQASDVDLLVDRLDHRPLDRMRLGMRLGDKLGRGVDVASLEQAERDPLTMLQVLDEGRVIVDREGQWPSLRDRRPAIYQRAGRSYRAQQRRAASMIEGLRSP